MVAFHFPPCAVSSGLQRTLSFTRHLVKYAWDPLVLTVQESAHETRSDSQLSDIPSTVPVFRAFALDSARHLAVGGRYWGRLAVPDRWRFWEQTAVRKGLAIARRYGVDAIWSTYPIATAHRIASRIARASGKPWVADFRDPMVEILPETGEAFPADAGIRNARLQIEADAVSRASALVFCTDSARDIVQRRYPGVPGGHLKVIPNGYDEAAFEGLRLESPSRPRGVTTLLHSGTIYPGPDRDPSALFRVLARLKKAEVVSPASFQLVLRAPSNPDYFGRLAEDLGLKDIVSIAPGISYRDALSEMLSAEGLLLLQGKPSNPAVPAKLYEYLRARRPIIALVHPEGETAKVLRSLGLTTTADLTDETAIETLLRAWLRNPSEWAAGAPQLSTVEQFSRARLTESLARLLSEVAGHAMVHNSPKAW